MRLDHKLVDIVHMARDFTGVLRGTDYFHLPDLLGRYFVDGKSYYIDFRGKAHWAGAMQEDVPLLHVPALSRSLFHPGMVLQYGLGSIDMYFETGNPAYADYVRNVASWLFSHCNEQGFFDNLVIELNSNPQIQHYSNNSAMTQGEASSFLLRGSRHGILQQSKDEVRHLVDRIYRNVKLPIEEGGGTLYRNGNVYLCEYCRKDDYIVLNGWIFAIFGLWDYCIASADPDAKSYLQETVRTLADCITSFIVPHDNWSYYDNKQRLCSPPYQTTHINQVDALARLTGNDRLHEAHRRLVIGNSRYNQVKYTLKKVVEKVRDTQRYTTG